jgi:hypothetical protein
MAAMTAMLITYPPGFASTSHNLDDDDEEFASRPQTWDFSNPVPDKSSPVFDLRNNVSPVNRFSLPLSRHVATFLSLLLIHAGGLGTAELKKKHSLPN